MKLGKELGITVTEDEVTQALMSIERWVEWSEVRKDFENSAG